MPCIVFVDGGEVHALQLGLGEYTIGRSPDCSILVKDFGISRLHAKLVVHEDGVRLVDLKSKGGSRVGGVAVVESKLPDSAAILLGTFSMTFARSPEGPWPETLSLAIRAQGWTFPAASGMAQGAAAERNRFGPYVVSGPATHGRISEAYAGRHAASDAKVVVRILSGRPNPTECAWQMTSLVGLVHPNVQRILEAGVSNDSVYVAVEPWKDELASFFHRPEEALAARVAVVEGICAGLGAAHLAGFVHGDLDVAQIHLGPDDRPQVDFSDRLPWAEGGMISRNAAGLSPEQILGRAADARSDVFSASYIAYELLTGRRPFDRDSLTSLLYATLHEDPRPREDAPELPGALADWLLRGLAKEPARRFQSGEEMRKALPGR